MTYEIAKPYRGRCLRTSIALTTERMASSRSIMEYENFEDWVDVVILENGSCYNLDAVDLIPSGFMKSPDAPYDKQFPGVSVLKFERRSSW